MLLVLALLAADFHLELSRGSCAAGHCPVYRVSVDAHGAVTFEGLEYTSVIGVRKRALTVDELEQLEELVSSLREGRTCRMMDVAISKIRVRMNGRETAVRHNAACDSTEIEDRIDTITGIEAWRRYNSRLANRRLAVRWFGGGCAYGVACETQAQELARNALVLYRNPSTRLRVDRDGSVRIGNVRSKLAPDELRRLTEALVLKHDPSIHSGRYVVIIVPANGELRPLQAPCDSIPAAPLLEHIIAAYGSSAATHH